MSPENIDSIKKFRDEFSSYLKDFRTVYRGRVVTILNSPLKTAFLGFLSTLNNSINLFEDLIACRAIDKFKTLRITQDFLENHFGKIRQKGGFNRNPNTVQFEGTMRKLLFENEVKTSNCSNVFEHDIPLLKVPSFKKKPILESSEQQESATVEVFQQQQVTQKNTNEDKMLAYRAASLERAVLQKTVCQRCKVEWFIGERTSDEFVEMIKEKEEINQPMKMTMKLVKAAEQFSHYRIENSEHFEAIANAIFERLNIDNMYENSNHDEHKQVFIKNMIRMYLRLRFADIANNLTQNLLKNYWGNKAEKLKQFAGR